MKKWGILPAVLLFITCFALGMTVALAGDQNSPYLLCMAPCDEESQQEIGWIYPASSFGCGYAVDADELSAVVGGYRSAALNTDPISLEEARVILWDEALITTPTELGISYGSNASISVMSVSFTGNK